MSLWERISTLGQSADEPPGELRRSRLTNQSAVIGAVSCGSFAIGYAIAGPRFFAPMAANVATVALMAVALELSRRSARTAAKVAVLVPVNLVVVVASMLLGERVGFLYYFFLFAAVAFLLFDERQRVFRWGLALLSVASCAFVLATPRGGALVAITPALARTLDVTSAIAVIATVLFIVDLFTSDTARAEARLAEEHARSERLLLNVLPAEISARLKRDDQAIADRFDRVTVLFADIVGFTELSQTLPADELVKMLNTIFSAFDDLAEKLGLEKIKTIGDCYMVAAGLPTPRADHAAAIARMALGMRDAVASINAERGYALRVRIGLHTGAVVAGVIGKRKFIYDLWGDTVNTASRMESSGVPGEIQVTRAARDELGDAFDFEPRGAIHVKGKGEMETFFLKGERAQIVRFLARP